MFDAIVFSGGGSRCFWQAGFCQSFGDCYPLAPQQVAAASAGAAMACLTATAGWARALDYFKVATGRNRRNFYPRKLARGDAFPHETMYREAILAVLEGGAFERVRTGPDVRILLARPPHWSGHRRAAVLALAAYKLEAWACGPVHPRFGRWLGFQPEIVRARDCQEPEELADMILHSSCTPPFTPLFRRDGRPVLDGGAIDPVPLLALERPRRTLVLLTKRYPRSRIPRRPNTVYVQPSQAVPISKWDYTSPDRLQQTFDLGRRDGESFSRRFRLDGEQALCG